MLDLHSRGKGFRPPVIPPPVNTYGWSKIKFGLKKNNFSPIYPWRKYITSIPDASSQISKKLYSE